MDSLSPAPVPPSRLFSWPVWTIATATFLAHMLTATGYGVFRDEFYYLACADHLAWGYVDHPPLSIAVLALVRMLIGSSAIALQLVPALLHAATVLLTARLARRMGAEGFGATLAALCIAVAPGLLGLTSFYSMNAFDLVFYAATMLIFVRILHEGGRRRWLLLGVVVGLGLLNKYSLGFLVAGLAVGLLFSPRRRELLTPWPWLGAAIAILLFLPHVLWQVTHDWPTREFIANAQQYKIADMSPLAFLTEAWLDMQPPSITVWLTGLVALLIWRPLRPFRPLGVAWLVVLAILLVQKSKPYYLDASFPMLFAAGGLVWERIGQARRWRWTKPVQVVSLVLSGIAIAPFAIPALPVETFLAYNRVLGIVPQAGENHELGPLPQHFADRFGWPELTAAVARAYDALTPAEQQSCLIVGRNYGQAGALRYYGRELGLPLAVSQHNSFYLWGPGGDHFDVVLVVGFERNDLLQAFTEVTAVAHYDHPLAMPYERHGTVYLCRGPRLPLAEVWPQGRMYI